MSITIPGAKNTPQRNQRRWIVATIVGLALIAASHFASATDALSIGDFAGHFRGEAQVQAGDRFFIQQLRDADVDLRAEDDGFRLRWTTVIHSREGGTTKLRQRAADLRFVAGPMPGQFRTAEPFEPFTEKPTAWAYIEGNRFVVHVLSVLTDGNYELQTYERVVSEDRMTLHFTRISPGQPELVVFGRLIRQPQ